MPPRPRFSFSPLFVALSLALAPLLTGCAGSSDGMRKIEDPSATIAAPADRAVVVFLRPSGMAFAVNFAVVDQSGRWLGDAVAKSRFAVSLPPGDYLFAAWSENTDAIRASLGAGRIYYVEVSPALGFLQARVSLHAVTPRSAEWRTLGEWVASTNLLEPLARGGEASGVDAKESAEHVEEAERAWSELSAEDREEHTLRVGDGAVGQGGPPPAIASRAR